MILQGDSAYSGILGFFVKEKQVHMLNTIEKSTSCTKQHSSIKFWP